MKYSEHRYCVDALLDQSVKIKRGVLSYSAGIKASEPRLQPNMEAKCFDLCKESAVTGIQPTSGELPAF